MSMWAVTGSWAQMCGKIAAVFVEEMEAAARSSRGSSMTPCLKEVMKRWSESPKDLYSYTSKSSTSL